jgi:uncharacterized protein YfiM (DUF2279 family)
MKLFIKILLVVLISSTAHSQSEFDNFFKPSDSLNTPRRNGVIIAQSTLMGGTLLALSQVWYKEHQKSDFHLYNDNIEWLQMDKAGHVFSAYQLSRASSELFQWSGVSKNQSVLYGSLSGFAFLSTVEVFDGFSSEWGFSYGDMIANFMGSAFYAGQELLWDEQRILLKFSYHTTPYASRRPELLGSNLQEQILKDYNGQTYWLSFNLHSFLKDSKIPKWLNLALGYGAEGMITGQDDMVNMIFLPEKQRFRQYYLSLDVDLTKIKTNSHFLKSVFSVVNTIKIPAPTFEITSNGKSSFHIFYF